MAEQIHLELLADFFNRIGQDRTCDDLGACSTVSAFTVLLSLDRSFSSPP